MSPNPNPDAKEWLIQGDQGLWSERIAKYESGLPLLSVAAFKMSMFCQEDSVSRIGLGAATLRRLGGPIGSRLPAQKAEAALKEGSTI